MAIHCIYSNISSVDNDQIVFFLQTMALWLKNTNYPTDHGICFGGLKIQISLLGVSLFQTKTVKEFLWGYEDPLLKFAYDARLICPAPDDLNPFVQLQVGK